MYFRYHYINPPQTIFKNIYKIKHGHYVIFKNNKKYDNVYWDVIEEFNNNLEQLEKNFDVAKTILNKELCNFIENIVKKEENIGVYISGGIDSSLVAALCSKYSTRKINTFSIGFYEEEYNEADKSRKIAEFLGTNHHELYITKEKLLETIKKISQYYSKPFSDSSELPTIILKEFAKENNIKVALTGDGADQLFCGCSICDTMWKCQNSYMLFNPFHLHISPFKLKNRKKLAYIFSNTDKKYQAQCDILYNEMYLEGLFADEL